MNAEAKKQVKKAVSAAKKVASSKKNNVKEVIIATSATIEGQTTAHYINDSLKGHNVKITKLAHGLPVGSEIEYLDDGTLFSAFKYRNSISEK